MQQVIYSICLNSFMIPEQHCFDNPITVKILISFLFTGRGSMEDVVGPCHVKPVKMNDEDIFIMSNGHACVAMYVVIEKYFGIDAVELLQKYGEHPKRNEEDKIYCSTGSLGMGITVATGRALANKNRDVYCLISDGECAEGSVWEALRFIKEKKLSNLHIYVNANGWAAYDTVDLSYLENRLKSFLPSINFIETTVDWYGLSGQSAHYTNLTNEQYESALKKL